MVTVGSGSITRMWCGAPIKEAEEPLRVFLLKKDIDGAERGDPTNCAFARAVRRACGAERAVFLRRTAYVELLQADGSKKVERFVMPENMRKIIEAFDKSGECPDGGFVLGIPRPSERLENKRVRNTKSRRAGVAVKGTSRLGTYSKPVETRVNGVRQVDGVRHGAGQVQFPRDDINDEPPEVRIVKKSTGDLALVHVPEDMT